MSMKIFCLLDCFDNYSIVASKIIEFYIQNAGKDKDKGQDGYKTTVFFDTTPYMYYAANIEDVSQYNQYITMLALTAVTLYRISDADATVFAHQGVVPNPGFATMYAEANNMNKVTAYWTDDLRNLWGHSDNPLMIGMTPLPFKYLWNTTPSEASIEAHSQPYHKGMNGEKIELNIGVDKDLCDPTENWNTFKELLANGKDNLNDNTPYSVRVTNLVNIGKQLVEYIETNKNTQYGRGWDISKNYTLLWDMMLIIQNNSNLLNKGEQVFIKANKVNLDQPTTSSQLSQTSMKVPTYNRHKKNNTAILQAMSNGMAKMMK